MTQVHRLLMLIISTVQQIRRSRNTAANTRRLNLAKRLVSIHDWFIADHKDVR